MIVKAKRLITGDGTTVIEDGAVAIQGDIIAGVGKAQEVERDFPGEEVRDMGEASILPGLIDMHVHLGNCQTQPDIACYTAEVKALMTAHDLAAAMRKGVTTVRDVSSEAGFCRSLKFAADKGFITSPRIFTTGQGLCMSGGHAYDLPANEQVDSPWEVRRAVRQRIRDGADWIKLMTSHRSDIPEYTQEELQAAADECHRVGKKLCAHAGTQPSIQMCIDAGIDTIEHATYLTVPQAQEMKRKGLAWTPTIYAYKYIYDRFLMPQLEAAGISVERLFSEDLRTLRRRFQQEKPNADSTCLADWFVQDVRYFLGAVRAYEQNFKALKETGVTILAGTDMVIDGAPVTPVDIELGLFVKFGMTPVEAVGTATGAAACVLGMKGKLGELVPGALADIAVFCGDVAEDITKLAQCRYAMCGGIPVAMEQTM